MSAKQFETILYEKSGPVATLTMNRPERNGMTTKMLREAHEALTIQRKDRELRVLVLTGAGKSFCPGADLQLTAAGADSDEQSSIENFRVPVLLHTMPAVTIAAINGACAGAGLGWALGCDLRYAAPSARFNTAFLDVGVAGDMGGPWTLPRIVGAAKARELYSCPTNSTHRKRCASDWCQRSSPMKPFAATSARLCSALPSSADRAPHHEGAFRRGRADGLRELHRARIRASFADVQHA